MKNLTAPTMTNQIFAEAFVVYINDMTDANWADAMKVLPDFQDYLDANGCDKQASSIELNMNCLKLYNGRQAISWDSVTDIAAVLNKTGLHVEF
jgi:hypothetical protein